MCISAGRVGSIFCPMVYELMSEYHAMLSGSALGPWERWAMQSFRASYEPFFALMLVLCVVNAGLVALLPYETQGMILKEVDSDDEEK